MASKAFKRKERVKRQKAQRKPKSDKKYAKYAIYTVFVVLAVYLSVTVALKPPFLPGVDDDPSTGPSDAAVTVIQFGCYTCPYTKEFNNNVLPQLMEEYAGRINFVFRSAPIYSNAGAKLAHMAADCANEQGKFFEYSKLLFKGPSTFDKAILRGFAESLDLDMVMFNDCLDSKKYEDEVDKDYQDAKKAGVSKTPTLFVNGIRIDGARDKALLERLFDDMLEEEGS